MMVYGNFTLLLTLGSLVRGHKIRGTMAIVVT